MENGDLALVVKNLAEFEDIDDGFNSFFWVVSMIILFSLL